MTASEAQPEDRPALSGDDNREVGERSSAASASLWRPLRGRVDPRSGTIAHSQILKWR
jgi:hypothetical protein